MAWQSLPGPSGAIAEPDLCGDDPSRKLMRQIFGAIAEYDKAVIVIKLRVARQRMNARDGRCEGRKPFGHRPGEPEVIERIRALRGEGLGVDSIADRLTRTG
jgi:DNA invertase Pin-like site-specific DNA recombinase